MQQCLEDLWDSEEPYDSKDEASSEDTRASSDMQRWNALDAHTQANLLALFTMRPEDVTAEDIARAARLPKDCYSIYETLRALANK